VISESSPACRASCQIVEALYPCGRALKSTPTLFREQCARD
jgi:hypothetical protein